MKTTTTNARAAAYEKAAAFIGCPVEYDRHMSDRAGYPVMVSADGESWISDLGTRYEANRADGSSVNFWIDAPADAAEKAPAVVRLPYAGPEVMNADPGARAPRKAREYADDGRTWADVYDLMTEYENMAARSRTAARVARDAGDADAARDYAADARADEKAAADVRAELVALVGACVYRAAETIGDRIGATPAAVLDGIREDADAETWARCLERAADPEQAAAPLALFVYRAASAAVNKLHYETTGHRGRLTSAEARQHYGDADTGRAVIVTDYAAAGIIPGPEAAAIDADIIPRCLAYVAAEKRENAAAVVAAVAAGYSVTEAARALHIPERAAYDLLNAVKAARCMIDAEDGDAAALARREMSDARALAQLDKRRRAAAVAAVAAAVAAPDAREAAAAAAAGPRFSPAYAARMNAAARLQDAIKAWADRPAVVTWPGRMWADADARAAAVYAARSK